MGLLPLSKDEVVGGEARPDPPTHLPRHQLCNVVASGCQHSYQSIREKSASLASRWEGKKLAAYIRNTCVAAAQLFGSPELPSYPQYISANISHVSSSQSFQVIPDHHSSSLLISVSLGTSLRLSQLISAHLSSSLFLSAHICSSQLVSAPLS